MKTTCERLNQEAKLKEQAAERYYAAFMAYRQLGSEVIASQKPSWLRQN